MLEVRIETVGRLRDESSSSSSNRDASSSSLPRPPPPPVVDINWRPNNENEPLLLVFSNDRRRHGEYVTNELDEEVLDHETSADRLDFPPNKEPDSNYIYYDEEVFYEYEDDVATETRKKRAAAAASDSSSNIRKRTGRASRVVREAKEREEMDLDILSPSDEIDYPMEIARRLQMTRRNETRSAKEEEEEEDDEEGEEDMENGERKLRYRRTGGRRLDGRQKRVRRSGKRRLRRNSCHRMPMYVNFEDINWHHWILRPFGYQVGCS